MLFFFSLGLQPEKDVIPPGLLYNISGLLLNTLDIILYRVCKTVIYKESPMKTWVTKSGTEVFQILDGRSNSYAVKEGKVLLIIDTARKSRWKMLEARLDSLGLRPAALILTHTHFDHAENAASIKGKYHAMVYVHKAEASYLASGNCPLPKGCKPITTWMTEHFAERFQHRFSYQPVAPDITVDAKCDLGSLGFKAGILHTPGHSKGSQCITIDGEIAFVGDTLYGVYPDQVLPPFADDVNQMIQSWERLLDSGCKLFLPGHGRQISRELLEKEYQKYRTVYLYPESHNVTIHK